MPLKLERLTASELEALPKEMTVFFFSLAPLEDFGPHLPLGTALAISAQRAWIAAERLERDQPGWIGVCVPACPMSVSANTTHTALTVRGHVVRDWLVDSCTCLSRMGFSQFVCISGNAGPRQLTAVEEAGKFLRARARITRGLAFLRLGPRAPTLISADSGLIGRAECFRSPLWPDPTEHAGQIDTSLALAVLPDLVKPDYQSLPEIKVMGTRLSRWRERITLKKRGYWGNPAAATPDQGRERLREQLEDVMPKLRAVWSGSNPERVFRSWYSVIPPNGSFFKAWVLALAVAILLSAWLLMTFRFALGG